MSPFSHLLHDLRKRHGVRQVELAARVGYEQSYISALEIGSKGPPTPEFVERLITALNLSEVEQQQVRDAADASKRKFVIEDDISPDAYWMLKDLRDRLPKLSDAQVRIIRDVLRIQDPLAQYVELKRRGHSQGEARM